MGELDRREFYPAESSIPSYLRSGFLPPSNLDRYPMGADTFVHDQPFAVFLFEDGSPGN
jgi:hypothetical protein